MVTALADVALLRAEPVVYGAVASDPTVSRSIAALAADAPAALKAIGTARSAARRRAWALAGKDAPDHATGPLVIDVDATLLTAHSVRRLARSSPAVPSTSWRTRSASHDPRGHLNQSISCAPTMATPVRRRGLG